MVSRSLTVLLFVYIAIVPSLDADDSSKDQFQNLNQGQYAVGYVVQHRYDHSRSFKVDSGREDKGGKSEMSRPVQISIWYPATQDSGKAISLNDYLLSFSTVTDFSPPGEQRVAAAIKVFRDYMDSKRSGELSDDLWRRTVSEHMIAKSDAEPLSGPFPLLVYAPGNPGESFENARMFEFLASHGYVVAAIPVLGDRQEVMQNTLEGIEAQSRDVEFVLASMREFSSASSGLVGVFGFSWGGLTIIPLGMRNLHVDAVVSMDGAVIMKRWLDLLKTSPEYHPEEFQVPAMLISGKPTSRYEFDDSFFQALTQEDAYLIRVPGLNHGQFRSLANRLNTYSRKDISDKEKHKVNKSFTFLSNMILRFFNCYLKITEETQPFEVELRALDPDGDLHSVHN